MYNNKRKIFKRNESLGKRTSKIRRFTYMTQGSIPFLFLRGKYNVFYNSEKNQ